MSLAALTMMALPRWPKALGWRGLPRRWGALARGFYAAMMDWRRLEAERHMARRLLLTGGLLTDAVERAALHGNRNMPEE